MSSQPITLEEIIFAFQQLGGESSAKEIKDRVTLNRGGMPSQYKRSHSYRETIQRIIENHCPQSSNFRGIAHFERVSRGRYRLVNIEWVAPEEDDEESFPEGKEFYKLHRMRERNAKVVNLAKKRKLQIDPLLPCEICGFSFVKVYGELGKEFIEAHHAIPLSSVGESETRIEDIVLVCSNCHKMLHRRRPWLSISKLRNLLIYKTAS